MKYIRNNETRKIKNGDACIVTEYDLHNNHIDIARAHIRGRYPESGYVQNKLSTEVCLVINGVGHIIIDEEKITLASGDVVLIESGEKFFWEGDMELVISCSPPWSADQYIHMV